MPRTLDDAAGRAVPMRCPHCGQHFSPEGRFCPFDGDPLVLATDWDPKDDALLGTTIDGRYEVEALIGEGGMGRVYRVRHTLLGKYFALKALRRDLANDSEIADRFIHEARTAASVTHQGLVQISDFGHLESGQAFFVMELLEGIPLSSLLRRHGALPPARAVAIAINIAEALEAAHEASVVHRDLKPDNIHVDVEGNRNGVKIVDFGLAKVIGASKLTREGIVFGTPYYMSPEQAAGEPIDHRVDIYALGIVLYEMLTGRVPFEADTYMGVLSKHLYVKPIAPSEVLGVPGALGALEEVVLRCLEKDPNTRYLALGEVSAALRAIPVQFLEALGAKLPRTPVILSESREELVSGALTPPGLTLPRWSVALGLVIASALLGSLVVAKLVAPNEEEPAQVAPARKPERAQTERERPDPTRVRHSENAPGSAAGPGDRKPGTVEDPAEGRAASTTERVGSSAEEPAKSSSSSRPALAPSPREARKSKAPRDPEIIYPWAE